MLHVPVAADVEHAVAAGAPTLRLPLGADAAIVFDSEMFDESTPALTLGVRGLVHLKVRVRAQPRDLHSGLYGGSALNATHVLHSMLAQVMPGRRRKLTGCFIVNREVRISNRVAA